MATKATTPATLRQLLLQLAQHHVGLADKAEEALHDATGRYFSSKPDLDAAGARVRSGISEDRGAVRKVERMATGLKDAVVSLSIHARLAIGEASEAPLGTLTIGLEGLLRAIPTALQQLKDEKDKPGDYHLNVWAYEVAIVLRDVLHITPACTRYLGPGAHGRGGAAYAQLLQEAHQLISARSLDFGRLTDAGLTLLDDPTGDLAK